MFWTFFSDPQVAGVGLRAAQAQGAGHEVVTSVLPLSVVRRAPAARDTRGLIKPGGRGSCLMAAPAR